MKNLRVFTRLGGLLLLMALALVACAGEAFVTYEGTVTAGTDDGWSFDATRNPSDRPPIPGARIEVSICVEACVGDDRSRVVTADTDGRWGPVDRSFGSIGGSHLIQIDVAADGYDPVVYVAVYESTGDPLDGERFLNFVLKPTASTE